MQAQICDSCCATSVTEVKQTSPIVADYILYELRVGQHEKIVEDGVQAAVCGLGITDETVQLLLNLVRL